MKAEDDNSAKSVIQGALGFVQALKKRVDEARHLMTNRPPQGKPEDNNPLNRIKRKQGIRL